LVENGRVAMVETSSAQAETHVPGSAGRRRPLPVVVAAVIVALAAGAVVGWVARDSRQVQLVAGTTGLVTADGEAVALNETSYAIGTGLLWQGTDGVWRDGGQPECLPPLSRGARVELATTDVKPAFGGPGFPAHVVWVRCLSLPGAVDDAAGSPAPPLDTAYRAALERK
jgi:hypothetical protein